MKGEGRRLLVLPAPHHHARGYDARPGFRPVPAAAHRQGSAVVDDTQRCLVAHKVRKLGGLLHVEPHNNVVRVDVAPVVPLAEVPCVADESAALSALFSKSVLLVQPSNLELPCRQRSSQRRHQADTDGDSLN